MKKIPEKIHLTLFPPAARPPPTLPSLFTLIIFIIIIICKSFYFYYYSIENPKQNKKSMYKIIETTFKIDNAKSVNKNVNKNVKKMSPTLKKNIFWILLESKMGGPPEPPATARTPRPIFDDKECSKNVFLMSGTFGRLSMLRAISWLFSKLLE